MKNLNLLSLSIITLIILSSCSSNAGIAPSQNKSLNRTTISTAGQESEDTIQKSLDKWLKNDWTPTVEKNETIKTNNKDKSRDFTIQEYVDKSEIYIDKSDSNYENSHSQKMNSMPVIGH